ncbi:MAG: RagB/SusD family nutrient uptake outer membrane protein [Bacteroidaceae bacterium]|nr:RagB/SusD family nutrient uptake outer membrane protein [Bacteroidaceae bacterium]
MRLHITPLSRLLPLLLTVLLLSACSDFLKEEDKDKVIPRTMDQFESMLHQEGFCDVSWFYTSEFMTDDVSENASVITTSKNNYKSMYTWQYDIERTGEGDYADLNNMWGKLYNDVLVANYILERSSDIVDADIMQSRKNSLEAEAHFLRARAYFELINTYAPAYDASTAAATLGVPLREGTGITNRYQRNTVAEVYAQIEQDLADAIALFDQSTEQKSLWHPNKKAALLLLSRMYLYKSEWQKVVDTTTDLIRLCPQGLYAMNRNLTSAVVRGANPEVLHTWGVIAGALVDNEMEGVPSDIPKIYRADGSLSTAAYGVSDELLNMYSEDDVRLMLYFKNAAGIQVTAKWHPQYTTMGSYTYRLAEAYLSRAEANAAMGKTQEALDDMTTLLSKRIDGDCTAMLPAVSDQMAVRRFVLDQRRMELCFEGHRWFDLRRTQSWYQKDIEHVFSYSSSTSGTTGTITESEAYTLPSGSPNYTLELPLAETTVNPNIEVYGKREQIKGIKR